jgi:hypothetical protein
MDTRFSIEGEELPTERRLPFWQRVGGGALTFAILFHVILLIIGAIWIFQTVIIPQKNAVDFLPGGDGGGGERAAQSKRNAPRSPRPPMSSGSLRKVPNPPIRFPNPARLSVKCHR